ncbi:MAG TPA: hypothetical protein VGO68_21380, partial [Pyrinomonadaceae bacterium]|nr:hypothetical protein [Pyrinomonadaceae bacterium]
GNKVVGEGIKQTNVSIQAGRTYRVSACVKVDASNRALPAYVRFNVRASNGPIVYTATGLAAPTIGIIGSPSNTPSIPPPGIVSQTWLSVTLADWTAPASFNTITINPENDNVVNDGGTVSWGHLDDVCIQEVKRRDPGNGSSTGEPHINTVDGIQYDFQSAGEFVALRGNGIEIQARQTAAATSSAPAPNPYTGLANCVTFNTAVAARVGSHRVTFEPNLSGRPDPGGLQLRVDGTLRTLGTGTLALSGGGSIAPSSGGGIRIDFPEGTTLVAIPGWWGDQGKWFLHLTALNTRAGEGIIGAIAPGSWLPALPNGASLGPKPASLHQRFLDLYGTFADAWRVTDSTSLFDYAPGTSTATFTDRGWPVESGACKLPKSEPVKPMEPDKAKEICRSVADKILNVNCVYDVTITGEAGFAKTYLLTQQIRIGTPGKTIEGRPLERLPTQPIKRANN